MKYRIPRFLMLRSSPICIRGEVLPVRESPTRDGYPECNAFWSGVGLSGNDGSGIPGPKLE